MRIDFSTVFLLIVLVIPGLFAKRSRNRLAPMSFAPKGATEELAELVTLGVLVHVLIILGLAAIMCLLGLLQTGHFDRNFNALSHWLKQVLLLHRIEGFALASLYILFTFLVGYLLGLVYGWLEVSSPITACLQKTGILRFLHRFGFQGMLSERPIIYEVLNPGFRPDGDTNLVFVEIELKNSAGFYAGQVQKYAIVRDEEPHKLVYIVDAWFKRNLADRYESSAANGILIDLADVLTLSVRQEPSKDIEISES